MKPRIFLLGPLLSVALLAPQTGWACGEGIYAMSEGASQQGYLAPRLATVLVYNDQATVPDSTKAVYRGLVHAGHKVEVARNPAQLAAALQNRRYDVVIASYDRIGLIDGQAETVTRTGLLPVLTSEQRSGNGWRERFRFSLTRDSGLGQYLKLIDKLVKTRT